MDKQTIWSARTPGIPDHLFIRGKIPMTKEEVRAVTISKGQLKDDSIVYDLGAGTGSISIEAALQAPKGHVYAIERVPEGITLIKANQERFGIENLTVINAEAPTGMQDFPPADCIIIGGSGGRLKEMLLTCDSKLKTQGRLIINAVTLETLFNSIKLLEEIEGYSLDVCSLAVTRVEKIGSSHMLKALNPIYIITAEKESAYEG